MVSLFDSVYKIFAIKMCMIMTGLEKRTKCKDTNHKLMHDHP